MSLNELLKKIGVFGNEDLLTTSDKRWKRVIPYRLHKGLTEINPDVFYVQKNKPIALFFDFTNQASVDLTELFKKIWNLGGVPLVYIIKTADIEIYNGFSFNTQKLKLDVFKIKDKKVREDEISFWDILSGKLWRKLPKPKNQVDEKLLENIQAAKEELVKKKLDEVCANNIIGRLLFSRYLIDRGVIVDKKYFSDKKSFLDVLKNKNKKLLYEYFEYLKDNFNGDLFPVTNSEKNNINDSHLDLLYSLFNGDQISSGQKSLFDTYDFKIIPVELISEVYERFIGIDKQRKDGAYYTPSFLVDYILEKTVKDYLKRNKQCKVFDPSCGSGIFLVETLRCIIEKNNPDKKISKKELVDIVKNNIFGVDKNESAVNISIFSLCLTLLDYVEPKDIAKFRFPRLKDNNLFVADFFDIEDKFNKKVKDINYILGNPPWGSTKSNDSHVEYSKANEVPISDNQIAQSFITRAKDFSNTNIECALVIASKTFYNHNAYEFRKYWLDNFLIKEILELSSVRSQLFVRATAPSAIVFYKHSQRKNTKNNVTIHSSVKPNIFLKYLKLIVIEKNDIKEIKQGYFQKYDWLWKVMLYGNVFDFYFLKRFKEMNNSVVNDLIQNKKVVFSAGFISGQKNRKEMKDLEKMSFIERGNIKPYFQNYKYKKIVNKFPDLSFKDKGVIEAYKSPHLLLKRTLKDRPILTYLEKDCAFPNNIFGIHSKDKELLKALGSYFSSRLARYFLFLTSSTWGIEREEVLQKEYKALPFSLSDETRKALSGILEEILNIAKDKYNAKKILDNINYDKKIDEKIKKIDSMLSKEFQLTELDKKLIDYNIDISVPLFYGQQESIDVCTNDNFKEYVQVFFEYFNIEQGNVSKLISADIYFNRYIVAMNFNSTKDKSNNINFIDIDKENRNNFFDTIKFGEEKIADKFYKQRDVRGINKESFYIIKSNQYKNWHPAVAQVDLHEFVEAIMQSGIKGKDV